MCMDTIWLILIAVVIALNLRFVLPAVFAFLGLWTPQARL
jgi:hypothetical protein